AGWSGGPAKKKAWKGAEERRNRAAPLPQRKDVAVPQPHAVTPQNETADATRLEIVNRCVPHGAVAGRSFGSSGEALDNHRRSQANLALRVRDFDAVLQELVPDADEHVGLGVDRAVCRVVDPDAD